MSETNEQDKKKIFLAVGVTGIAVAIMAGTWFWSQSQTAAQDRAALQAQRGGGPGGPGGPGGMGNPAEFQKRMMDQLTKDLGLTPEQRTKIEEIQTAMMSSMPPPGQGMNNTSRDQLWEAMRKQREESDAKIKAVLTAEQQTKFEAMQQQMQGRGGPGGPPPNGMGGPPPGFPPTGTTPNNPPAGSSMPNRS